MGWGESYSTMEECVCECVGHIHIRLSSDTGVGHCGVCRGWVGGERGERAQEETLDKLVTTES